MSCQSARLFPQPRAFLREVDNTVSFVPAPSATFSIRNFVFFVSTPMFRPCFKALFQDGLFDPPALEIASYIFSFVL